MFTIIEANGGILMGAVLTEEGETLTFKTEKEAEYWAQENCAFDWQIISI